MYITPLTMSAWSMHVDNSTYCVHATCMYITLHTLSAWSMHVTLLTVSTWSMHVYNSTYCVCMQHACASSQ